MRHKLGQFFRRLNPRYWTPFRERNLMVVGAVGIIITLLAVVASLEYDKIPFLSSNEKVTAYFSELGGLKSGGKVLVSGTQVGKVGSVSLDGDQVRVDFTVRKGVHLGESTTAAIKTETALGAKYLAITPAGNGTLNGAIPRSRTVAPYDVSDALGDLTNTISGLDTKQLSQSLTTLSNTFANTPDDVRVAVEGVSRLSDTLNTRDEKLRGLLDDANAVSGILAKRSNQIGQLARDVDLILIQLQARSDDIDRLLTNISAVSRQLSGLVADNRDKIGPALDQLNGVLDILNKHKKDIQTSITRLNAYAGALGESVASGPFFKAYLANLLPGQFLQPFVDAAFKQQGLDLNTLIDDFLPPQYLPDSKQDFMLRNKPNPTVPATPDPAGPIPSAAQAPR